MTFIIPFLLNLFWLTKGFFGNIIFFPGRKGRKETLINHLDEITNIPQGITNKIYSTLGGLDILFRVFMNYYELIEYKYFLLINFNNTSIYVFRDTFALASFHFCYVKIYWSYNVTAFYHLWVTLKFDGAGYYNISH